MKAADKTDEYWKRWWEQEDAKSMRNFYRGVIAPERMWWSPDPGTPAKRVTTDGKYIFYRISGRSRFRIINSIQDFVNELLGFQWSRSYNGGGHHLRLTLAASSFSIVPICIRWKRLGDFYASISLGPLGFFWHYTTMQQLLRVEQHGGEVGEAFLVE